MDIKVAKFLKWIINLDPEYVWLGFNTRPKSVPVPEPSAEKMTVLISRLKEVGIEIRGKELRGITV